ncbi:MAG: hypothetical protein Q9169_005194 [Polycauliona sp. 2 TL-2023]
MPSSYSVYNINEAEVPDWLPGEDYAAIAAHAMTLLLVVGINVHIHHVFQRRRGVYFWAMQIGSLGCFVDVIALMVRNFVHNSVRVWPLYTLLATVSWAVYTVAQLVVLYSRLHLVMRNERIQHYVFLSICVFSPILIITDWVVIWASWNPASSHRWSVATAIVERIAQLGFSIIEVTINVLYASSLIQTLRLKASVRQRRVMWDLLGVNALAILLDILNIILVYVNRVGISRPFQTLTYSLKLRLEFIVLNQLMAVAAHNLQRQTFGDRRYHRASDKYGSFDRDGMGLTDGAVNTGGREKNPSDASDMAILAAAATKGTTELSDREQNDGTSQLSQSTSDRRQIDIYPADRKDSSVDPSDVRKAGCSDLEKSLPPSPRGGLRLLWKNEDDEQEEHVIGLHEWERRAKPVLEVS